MHILVLSPGYIGQRIVQSLRNAGHDVTEAKVEITDQSAVRTALDIVKPEAVLNCAGKKGSPNVDWCESHLIPTYRSNTIGPLLIAEACQERGIHFVHLGTGCIFYGDSPDPAGWHEEDFANPQAAYTRTKYATDLILSELPNVAIIRLRMPIDEFPHPGNLIDKLASYPKIIDVQNSVTIVDDLITAVMGVIEKKGTGVFHAVNPGIMAHRDLLTLYTELVNPAHHNEWITDADLLDQGLVARKRSNNILQNRRLPELGIHLRPIETALRDVMEKYAKHVSD